MRSEKEIQALLDDLKKLEAMPCRCEGFQKLLCAAQQQLLHRDINVLSWVLGEVNQQADAAIEALAKRVRS